MSDRIAPGSTLIRNAVRRSLDALDAGTLATAPPLQLTANEFGGVRAAVQTKADAAGVLVVSIAGPAGVLPAGAAEVAAGAYAQYGTVRHQAAPPPSSASLVSRANASCRTVGSRLGLVGCPPLSWLAMFFRRGRCTLEVGSREPPRPSGCVPRCTGSTLRPSSPSLRASGVPSILPP